MSAEGVPQGDSISALAFAVAVQGLYKSISNRFPQVLVTAVLDDLTVVGRPSDLVGVVRAIQAEVIENIRLAKGGKPPAPAAKK